jgi:cell division protein FtsW (lipid II flippase)
LRPFPSPGKSERIENRLLILAAIFFGIACLALTLAPAVRLRSWTGDLPWTHWLAFLIWIIAFSLAAWQARRRLPDHDPYLLPAAGLLIGWGLLTVFRLFPNFGIRQTAWMVIAVLIFIIGLRLPADLGFLRRYKYLWLSGGLLLTGLTLLFGTNPLGFGPQMWLGCCGIYLQPSEPLKLLLIVYLAAYLADRLIVPGEKSSQTPAKRLLPLLVPTMVMTGLALVILLVQRDLGTASILLFLYAVIVYAASGDRKVLLATGITIVVAGILGYWLFDVVRLRLEAWINPWLDPSGRSYQIVQSLLAIANGGVIGRGIGVGNPGLVPIPHSDFIFSSVVEETGLIGAFGVILIIALFANRGIRSALNARDAFQRYLATGLTAYIVGQSILIIGGNLRMLPLTGVTLPMMSYGGSSLVTSIIALLLLLLIGSSNDSFPTRLRNSQPYLHIGGLLLAGLAALAIVTGWWTLYRSTTLLARTDNARRSISDRIVQRGTILDRENRPISLTSGQSGDLVRQILYPNLSPVIGYTDPVYGQSGMEASIDPILRGLEGNPAWMIWWNHLLYGQPPPGLDVRTSIDLDLQKSADHLLGSHKGAIVLLNAEKGEILAAASHPTFDANQLGTEWDKLREDKDAPLFNRVTQGLYTPGAALGATLLAQVTQQAGSPEPSLIETVGRDTMGSDCAVIPVEVSWSAYVKSGCPGVVDALVGELTSQELFDFYQDSGFFSLPVHELPADFSTPPDQTGSSDVAAKYTPAISPLQMALAIAPLSARGNQPAARLVLAQNDHRTGWRDVASAGYPHLSFSAPIAESIAQSLSEKDYPIWQTLSWAQDQDRRVTWGLAGTLPSWDGTPLVVVVLLEEDNPRVADKISQELLLQAMGE